MENKVLDIIISLLEGFKEEKEYKQHQLTSISNGRKYCIYNADYLLNQILRNLYLPDDHYLLSKGEKNYGINCHQSERMVAIFKNTGIEKN